MTNKTQYGNVPIIIAILIVIILAVGAVFVFDSKQKPTPPSVQTPTASSLPNIAVVSQASPSAAINNNFTVETKIASSSPCNTDTALYSCQQDIYLKDSSRKETYLFTTDNVMRNDSRLPEYRNGYIFLLKRTGDTKSNNWTDEVWQYNQTGNGRKLYAAQGVQFQVNTDASLVALASDKTVRIMAVNNTNVVKTYQPDVVSCVGPFGSGTDVTGLFALLYLRGWENTQNTVWGEFDGPDGLVGCYFAIDAIAAKMHYYPKYNSKDLVLPVSFNPSAHTAIYDNKTFQFDTDNEKAWDAAHPTHSYFVYNVETGEADSFATMPSTFRISNITWLSPNTFQYTTPDGTKQYQLPW